MKHLATLAVAVLLFAVILAPSTSAQGLRIGPHLGVNFDGTDMFVGASAQFPLNVGQQSIWGNVGIDLYPSIDGSRSRLNLDGLLPFAAGSVQLYFGGGLVAQFEKVTPAGSSREESDTDLGLNLKGGFLLGQPSAGFRPFVEFNQTIGAGSDFGVRGGVFLRLGGTR